MANSQVWLHPSIIARCHSFNTSVDFTDTSKGAVVMLASSIMLFVRPMTLQLRCPLGCSGHLIIPAI